MRTSEPTPEQALPESPRRSQRMWILPVAAAAIAFLGLGLAFWPEREDWRYDGQLHSVIAAADRIVVRDDGFDCCGPVDKEDTLFEVTDPAEIKEVLENLEFKVKQLNGHCSCCGFPGVDWYRGNDRLALTAIQHGKRLRWRDVPGDAELTPESRKWVVNWLVKHGVSTDEIEFGCGGPRRDAKRAANNEPPQSPAAGDHLR